MEIPHRKQMIFEALCDIFFIICENGYVQIEDRFGVGNGSAGKTT